MADRSPMTPVPVRFRPETIARLDELASQRSAMAGVEITRSDAVRLAAEAGLRVLLDGGAPAANAEKPRAVPPSPAVVAEPAKSMSDLAEMFPCLRGLPGIRPWDPGKLADTRDGVYPSGGTDSIMSEPQERRDVFTALSFVIAIAPELGAAKPGTPEGNFSLARATARMFGFSWIEAMSPESRAAFAAWVMNPHRPPA
ncbi:hypothetical protein [Sorangium sp. So ce362]|uniref:hypothetical protein n=1 Tax=Sorangium sp. So ce362 TaxID=3133303 RepID=UPI003F61C750